MASSGSGGNTNARPGIFSSHRGRKVKTGMIIAGVLSFAMFIGSGFAGDTEEQGQEQEQDQRAQAYTVASDVDPTIRVAPANPFDIERDLDLPDNFVQSSDLDAMMVLAQDVAVAYSTYSSRQTPENFVDTIPSVELISEELLEQAEESWAEIEEEGLDVQATASDIEPAVRGFNEDFMTVTLEVTLTQTATWPDGQSNQHNRTVTIMLGHEESAYVAPSLSEIEEAEGEDGDDDTDDLGTPGEEDPEDASEWHVISLTSIG